MRLAHRIVGPPDGPIAFLVHGILGSGSNLGGLARGLADRHPRWRFVVPDLRGHGDSGSGAAPHNLTACAQDLADLAGEVGTPQVVVGHSFGGKLALLYGQCHPGPPLQDIWVLDAAPGPLQDTTDHEVRLVLDSARALAEPFASRDAVTTHFLERGFSRTLAAWMTTNVRRTEAGLLWRPDLAVVEQLLNDYFLHDLWDFVESPGSVGMHIVRAGRSDRWDAATLDRLRLSRADVHVLPDAGHWVHVDDPRGVMARVGASLT